MILQLAALGLGLRDWEGAIILTSHCANLVRMLETTGNSSSASATSDDDGINAVFAFQDCDFQLKKKLASMSISELQAVCKASKLDVKGEAEVLAERFRVSVMENSVLGTVGSKVLKLVEGGFDEYCHSVSEYNLLQQG